MASSVRPKPRRSKLKEELTNIPNLLTYARIASIPVILAFVMHDSPTNCMWAALVYSLAATTDMLDGFVARWYGQVSMVGKFIDPLADKLMVLLLMLALLPLGRIPWWAVGVIMTRELAVTGLRAIAAGEGLIISASDSAKIKTTFQIVGNIALLLHYRYTLDFYVIRLDVNFHDVGMVFIYLSILLSVVSGVRYFKGFMDAVLAKEEEQANAPE